MGFKKVHRYVFDTNNLIGSGSFGVVYKGNVDNDSPKPQRVAIKALNKAKIDKNPYLKQSFLLQIKTLKKIVSSNVVGFKDVIESQHNYYIVQQFCDGGDFQKILSKGKIPQKQAVNYMVQILTGFYDIIRCGIVHRDFKPENILISNNKLKIADFGLARPSGQGQSLTSTVGTPAYQSPEILKGQKYTSKCDIWAVGMVFYQMLYGKLPWNNSLSKNGYLDEMLNKRLQFPPDTQVSAEAITFLKNCLKPQTVRFEWSDVFDHVLFKGRLPSFKVLNQIFDYAIDKITQNVQQNFLDLKKIFIKFNSKKCQDGMTRRDFHNMIRKLAPNVKSYHLDYVISRFDKDSNGAISFDEFLQTLQSQKKRIDLLGLRQSELRMLFLRIFQQNNQQIQLKNQQQRQKLRTRLNKKHSQKKDQIFNVVMEAIKLSGGKSLNLQSFSSVMRSIDEELNIQQCKFLFRQFDGDSDGIITLQQFFRNIYQFTGKK